MINANQLLKLINPPISSSVASLVRQILILDEKLSNTNNQSFYFKKGLESIELKREELSKEYTKILNSFNRINVDFLIEKRESLQKSLNGIGKINSFFKSIEYHDKKRQIAEVEDYLSLKGKTKTLLALENYSSDELIYLFFS